jgi:hypothetical protein
MTETCIALLGKKDTPTDAVEEYSRYLSAALRPHDMQIEIHRIQWDVLGWSDSLKLLRQQSIAWKNRWVLVQYTALGWSSRGFPQKLIHVLEILRSVDARVGIVFHDVHPYTGQRPIDFLRRLIQVRIMRTATLASDIAVFTVPPEKLSWLSDVPPTAVFVPVGPNLPIPSKTSPARSLVPTVGVFSITGGKAGIDETSTILRCIRGASQKLGRLRLSVFGRGADLHETDLRDGLSGLPVELTVEGIIDPQKVVERLSTIDVLLFVRGHISSRRGSAIAAIACGCPVIAYSGLETGAPITNAGIVLVSPDQPDELNGALVRVLSDDTFRKDLATRSRIAYQEYFSWEAIAYRLSVFLKAR